MFESDTTQFRQQLLKTKPPISTAQSLPLMSYSDEKVFELEKQTIFRSSWIGIGRSDQWRLSGDYSSLEIIDIGVIVLRDTKGNLRAYSNSCRHRGAQLVEGRGSCQVIRCPFHRWTYGLDGRLLTAPNMENSETFEYKQYGLIDLPISERDGFAFISFNQDVEPIDDWLGDFSKLHEPWSLNDLVTYKRHEFNVDCNWKAFLDVFNEYYHLPYVHPDSINSVYLKPEPADSVSGNYTSQFGGTEGTGGLLEATQQYSLPGIKSLDSRNANGARYSWVFPNMTFAAGPESVWIYEAYPLSSKCSKIVLTLCFPESTTQFENFEHSAGFYFERLIAAIDEDIPALENQQRGLNSPLTKAGRFCESLEPNVANFGFWYATEINKIQSLKTS